MSPPPPPNEMSPDENGKLPPALHSLEERKRQGASGERGTCAARPGGRLLSYSYLVPTLKTVWIGGDVRSLPACTPVLAPSPPTSGAFINDFLDLRLLCALPRFFGWRRRGIGRCFWLHPHLRVNLFVRVAFLWEGGK